MCHVVPRCFKLKWWPNRFSSLESDVADNAILVRIQQSAHRCVVAVFEGPVQVCITHPSPHPFLSLPFTLCTIPLWCPHQFEASLYTMCYPGQTPAPLNLPFERPPLSLPPFTRYKNTLTVVLTVLLYSRFKKRPIIPPTERECFWPVCYFPLCVIQCGFPLNWIPLSI
jgi:hypothetical protein